MPVFFRQLFESRSSTYTYLLACPTTKQAVLIDPVEDTVDRDAGIIKELGFNLVYAINTHCHADHVSGTYKLKQIFPECKSCIAEASGAQCDIPLNDNDVLSFGFYSLKCMSTPGHTGGCTSFLLNDNTMVFTGDALFIRGCGRTDFQSGSPATLYESVHTRLFSLPEDCLVYPGHDYKGRLQSSVAEEKHFNPRLTKTKEQFIDLMNNLNLAYPAQIDRAVPANLKDGYVEPPPPAADAAVAAK